MIILEGPDNAGKSTIAKKIEKDLNKKGVITKIKHFDTPDETFDFYDDYLKEMEGNEFKIFDRFFYSELVYSELLGREARISKSTIRTIEDKILEKNGIIYFVNPGIETLKNRLIKNGDEIMKENLLSDAIKIYKSVLAQSSVPVFNYYKDIKN